MTTLERYLEVLHDYESAMQRSNLPISQDLLFCIKAANIMLERERWDLDRMYDEGWNQCLNNQNK